MATSFSPSRLRHVDQPGVRLDFVLLGLTSRPSREQRQDLRSGLLLQKGIDLLRQSFRPVADHLFWLLAQLLEAGLQVPDVLLRLLLVIAQRVAQFLVLDLASHRRDHLGDDVLGAECIREFVKKQITRGIHRHEQHSLLLNNTTFISKIHVLDGCVVRTQISMPH